jgi:hypothetical protein
MAGVAPFCGPNTAAAPRTPHRGLSTSQATVISVSARRGSSPDKSIVFNLPNAPPPGANSERSVARNFAPSAWAMPVPPSLVALPPMPMMMRRRPASKAARISSPVP